jgi:hypothetical protein
MVLVRHRLPKETMALNYLLPAELVQEILNVLENNMFSSAPDGEEYNNDDVIEARSRLKALVDTSDLVKPSNRRKSRS